MKNQTVLFVMSTQTADREVEQLLTHAAGNNGRVICLVVAMAPEYPLNAFGALPYGGMDVPKNWIEEVTNTKKELKARCNEVEAMLQSAGVSGDVHAMHTVTSHVRTVVSTRALVCDVATIADNLRTELPEVFRAAIYGILFDSPIGLVLNGSPLTDAKRVFLAWNGELPAARAAHAALPILLAATDVHIAVFDPKSDETLNGEDPGADMARWLSHHGCEVTVHQYPSGGMDIGAALMRRAAEVGADLVVMGAYGRSRTRELIFGGTTRTMLDQTDAKVFIVH